MSSESIHMPFDGSDRNNYFYRPETADIIEHADMRNFHRYVSTVKGWLTVPFQINGSKYTIATDGADPQLSIKKMSVHHAVKIVTDKGFKLPADTRFFLTNFPDVLNQAFHFDGAKNRVCWITLGMTAATGGSGRGVSSHPTPGFAPATKIVFHELGHTFHAHNVGRQRFFSDARFRIPNPQIGTQVSDYASKNNRKEIIAETFTGMMVGREYGGDVMQFYAANGGPRIMQGAGREGFGIVN